jgi:hypothetical protein
VVVNSRQTLAGCFVQSFFDLLQGRVASETHRKGSLLGGNYFYGLNITLEKTDNYTIQAGNKVIRGYSTRKFNVMLHKMQFKTD